MFIFVYAMKLRYVLSALLNMAMVMIYNSFWIFWILVFVSVLLEELVNFHFISGRVFAATVHSTDALDVLNLESLLIHIKMSRCPKLDGYAIANFGVPVELEVV